MTKLLVTAFLVAILSVACTQQASEVKPANAREIIKSLVYGKDETTDLCFAMVATHNGATLSEQSLTITYVPCTERVLARLVK